ncbi:ferredoxin reductase-like protein [Wallemia mellicola]|nr:ferredoxin reductase-like protein [Wallemia mellicola]
MVYRSPEPTTGIKSDGFAPHRLIRTEQVNHDVKRFTFALQSEDAYCGLNVNAITMLRWHKPGNKSAYLRPYTPTSEVTRKGEIEFTIKRYEGGKMTPHLHSLQVGDTVEMGKQIQKIEYVPNQWDHVVLIGGGSGITPLYQQLLHSLPDTSDKTKFTLIYGNKTPADILLKKEFDEFEKNYEDRFTMVYTVDQADDSWKGLTGFVTKDLIAQYAPSKDSNVKILVCGPPGQMKAVSGTKAEDGSQGEVEGALAELGYGTDKVFKF